VENSAAMDSAAILDPEFGAATAISNKTTGMPFPRRVSAESSPETGLQLGENEAAFCTGTHLY
jgi:hypothetical protein